MDEVRVMSGKGAEGVSEEVIGAHSELATCWCLALTTLCRRACFSLNRRQAVIDRALKGEEALRNAVSCCISAEH